MVAKKKYGEFKCPQCKEVFHIKKQLDGHLGGAHRRNITKTGVPKCKHCGERLFEGQNWGMWAVKQRNLICSMCKNKLNRESHIRSIIKRKEAFEKAKKKYSKIKGE
jgi:DNA-directed RNA polymerase subunit RPC12/RpoP